MFDLDLPKTLKTPAAAPHEAPDTPPTFTLVAVMAMLATALLTGPGRDIDGELARLPAAEGAAPLAMACRLEPASGSGDEHLLIANTSHGTLPAGSRIGWASSGTPQPVGGVLVLSQALPAGAELTLFPAQAPLHAAGCDARVLADAADSGVMGPVGPFSQPGPI